MPNTADHLPGVVSWIELGTSDQNAAKSFYTSLLNWTVTDNDMGPMGVYTIFQLNGRDAAAGYTQHGEEVTHGVPPHWNVYFAVASADESASKASELGAQVLAGPFDVDTHGRMAVLQDPQGAPFCLWQAKDNPGLGIKNEPAALCWVDLNTPDRVGAEKFYSALFGWKFEGGAEGGYLHINAGGEMIGGVPSPEQLNPNAPPHWMIYLQVDDCAGSTKRALELGAKVCFGPVSMENVGDFSVIADPQGAVFSLFKPGRRS